LILRYGKSKDLVRRMRGRLAWIGVDDHAHDPVNERERDVFSSLCFRPYLLKNIQAVRANKTIVTTQRDELLISVFLAMNRILSPTLRLCEVLEFGLCCCSKRSSQQLFGRTFYSACPAAAPEAQAH